MSKPFTEDLTDLEVFSLSVEGFPDASGKMPRQHTERELLALARAAINLAAHRHPTGPNKLAEAFVGRAWEDHCARLDASLGISPRRLSTADGAAARNPR